jgi:hypothetical protein
MKEAAASLSDFAEVEVGPSRSNALVFLRHKAVEHNLDLRMWDKDHKYD